MKLIYNHFSMNRVPQSARFFLLPLILLTLISFSGEVSYVSAQDTPEICRQTAKVIEQYEREKEELESKHYYKRNEDSMRQNLSVVDQAIANGRLLKHETLETLAGNIRLNLPKSVGQMTPEERTAFQREARTFIIRKIQESNDINLEDMEQQLEQIDTQLRIRQERYNALHCSMVLDQEKEKGEVTVPNVINECESYGGEVCGTWTRRSNQFDAVWSNGAKAVLTIEQFDHNQVIITRNDIAGSVSSNFSARYTGKLSGNKILYGEVTWTQGARVWSGTWTANW